MFVAVHKIFFSKFGVHQFYQNISEILFIFKTKSSLSTSVLCSLPFPKFQKRKFIYFVHKYVETRPNCSHELTTFLKYHMPLRMKENKKETSSKKFYIVYPANNSPFNHPILIFYFSIIF